LIAPHKLICCSNCLDVLAQKGSTQLFNIGVCFRQPQLLVFGQQPQLYFDIMEEEGNAHRHAENFCTYIDLLHKPCTVLSYNEVWRLMAKHRPFSPASLVAWNSFPGCLRDTRSYTIFCRDVKIFFLVLLVYIAH